MKKIIALLMIVSFVAVSIPSAFAEESIYERGRVSGRVMHRQPNRGTDVRRPVRPVQRPSFNRSAPLDRRTALSRPSRPSNYDYFRHSRPIARHNSSFFNRTRYYNSHPLPQYRYRPWYYGNYRRSSSLSPLEFLGIGAAIIAIAAAANSTCCDY
jgi:Ni/Co efflux regulator RcnB